MFTKQSIAALHAKLDAAMAEFAAENGLVAGAARIKYSETEFKAEMSFSDKSSNPNEVDPRFLIDLKRRGYMHGLGEKHVGQVVILPSRQGMGKFTFLGMRASKAIFKSEADGKNYLFNADVASKYLNAKV